jgi:hypothetical protein
MLVAFVALVLLFDSFEGAASTLFAAFFLRAGREVTALGRSGRQSHGDCPVADRTVITKKRTKRSKAIPKPR